MAITKNLLSGSTNGKQIIISATTSGSATQIHTGVSGTTSFDEVYLYATNTTTSSAIVNILWGGTVEPNDLCRLAIPNQSGRVLIADGKLINNGLVISAYAPTASIITVDGFVNRIVP